MSFYIDEDDLKSEEYQNKKKIYKFKDSKLRNCYCFVPTDYTSRVESVPKDREDFVEYLNKIRQESHRVDMMCENDTHWFFKILTKEAKVEKNYETVDKIPNGYFEIEYNQTMGEYIIVESSIPEGDKFIELGSYFDEMRDELKTFYNSLDQYYTYNKMPKKGLLFYGVPGVGKTATIKEIIKEYRKSKVIFFVHGDVPFGLIKHLKYYNNEYIFIFEELTQSYRHETIGLLLSFLDGELSLERQVVIATTNYPEDLPGNLVDRPGRFDALIEVGLPDSKMRRKFLEEFLKTEIEDEIVNETKDLSLAYLSELAIQSVVKKIPLLDMIKSAKERKKKIQKQFAGNNRKMGL